MHKREFIGEFLGTFLMVLFGCGAVAVAVLFNSHQGLFQIAVIWGVSIALAIYACRSLSCAHFNPAVTVAMVVSKRMKASKMLAYMSGQFLGALFGACVLYLFFSPSIAAYEVAHHIIRGTAESMSTGKMFGEYYQLPGSTAIVSMPLAMIAEGFGTFLLVLMIFFLTEGCNVGRPDNNLAPIFVGLTVSSLICLIAPLTQAGFNPARDLAPRLVAWLAGWGMYAFPDQNGGFFFVYVFAPILGAVLAAGIFSRVVEPLMKKEQKPVSVDENHINENDMGEVTMTTKLILVGGFLGAGKTTLLEKMAKIITSEGKKVGLITNDQASALVDTMLLEQLGENKGNVVEVSGSCFCCNFPGFKKAVSYLKDDLIVDIIIAEPVGSCTDLSATIIQPLKKYAEDTLSVAPLSVLVDPERLMNTLNKKTGDLHPSAAYILEKQLDEADKIVINKIDLITVEALEILKNRTMARWPHTSVFAISAQTGAGVNEWILEVLTEQQVGRQLAEVDYDVYAEGEAVLGWLNTNVALRGNQINCDALFRNLLNNLGERFDTMQASVGHVKALVVGNNKVIVGNITGKKETLQIRGSVGKVDEASLTVNARVEMTPELLKIIVLEEIAKVCKVGIDVKETVLNCLQPGRPNPTYRFDSVV